MPGSRTLRLDDLSDAELAAIFRALPFAQRVWLACMCRRWRAICASGDVWHSVELNFTRGRFIMRRKEEETAAMLAWFAERRGSIHELTVVALQGDGTKACRSQRSELAFSTARMLGGLLVAGCLLLLYVRKKWATEVVLLAVQGFCVRLCKDACPALLPCC